MLLTTEEEAALAKNERERSEVAAIIERFAFGVDRRPQNEEEAEVYLNATAMITALNAERLTIVNGALRRWPGYKTYAELKLERLRERRR